MTIAASGCTVVSSQRQSLYAGPDAIPTGGIPYMLPKALIPVEVVANGASIRIDALEPIFIGDPKETYVLRYTGSAFAKDVVSVEVDPKTSLLKSLSIERKDETGEVLKTILASTIRAESATGTGDVVIHQSAIDPDDPASAEDFSMRADEAILAYLRRGGNCADADCKTAAGALLAEAARADTLSAEASVRRVGDRSPAPSKRNTPKRPETDPAAQVPPATATSGADCSIGICHRASLPYVVELRLLNTARQTVLLLPNKGAPVPLALDGRPFVTVKHTVALQNGIVQKYDVDKPSSALALVSWPLDVYDAIVSTTAKILQLKIDTSRNSVALQEQLVAAAEKRKELEDRLNKLQPESAALVDVGSKGRILTVGRGTGISALPKDVRDKMGGHVASEQKGTAPKDGEGIAPQQPSSTPKVMPGSKGGPAPGGGN